MVNTRTKTTRHHRRIHQLVLQTMFVIGVTFVAMVLFLKEIENKKNTNDELIVINSSTSTIDMESMYGRCYISPEEIAKTKWYLEKSQSNDIEKFSPQTEIVSEEIIEEEEETSTMISHENYDLLCKLTFAEASAPRNHENEMTSIAATVLNRLEDEQFPNTIYEVIFQEGQFSTAKNGYIEWYPDGESKQKVEMTDINDEVKDAVNKALKGEDPTEIMVLGGALYFYSDKHISDEERALRSGIGENVKYGDTIFYRK